MRYGILRQKRRLELNLSPNPFALAVGRIWYMVAAPATAELRTKIGALDLIELIDLAPGVVADSARNIDL